MRTGWLFPLLALTALASGAVWWLLARERPDEAVDAVSAPASREAPAPAPAGPTLEGVAPSAQATARGAGVIRGKVVREGAPADAEVTLRLLASSGFFERRFEDPAALLEGLFRLEPAPVAAPLRTLRAQDGAFAFEGLGAGVYGVSARDAEGLEASTMTGLLEERLQAEVTLALQASGATLEGRVVWSDGRPVAGRLAAGADEEGGMLPGLGESWGPVELDAEGRFRVGGLRAGTLTLRVLSVEGVLAIERGVVVPAKEPVVVTLEAPAQEVRGRVVSAVGEAPVSGAAVMSVFGERRGDRGMQLARATSAADGSFSVLAGPPPAQVMVLAAGFNQGEARAQAAEGLVVRLRPHGAVRGRVVAAADRTPIVGAVVVATGGWRERTATTVAEGRFEITGVAGRSAVVFVRGGGWVSPAPEDDAAAGPGRIDHPLVPGTPLELELVAVPSASLLGRVVDASGAPVPGARVSAQRQPDPGQHAFVRYSDMDVAVTGEDGRFRLSDLVPGAIMELRARTGGGDEATSGGHLVGGPPVELRLESGRWVEVTALHADDGSPVVGADVHLTAHVDGGSFGTSGPRTDAQGRARVKAPRPGPLTVRLRSDALARGQPDVPVEGSEGSATDLRVTVRAERGLALRGRVLLPDGRPAVGVQVHATAPQDDPWPWEARTDREGRFALGGAGTEEVQLQVTTEVDGAVLRGGGRYRAGGGEVALRLADVSQDFLTLHLRVLDPQGKPVPRASVQALLGDRGGESTEVSRGEARWRTPRGGPLEQALEGGTLTLEASHAQSEDGEPLPLGPARVGPLRADQREVVLRLPPERVIEGLVLDPEGKAVVGVEVAAERAERRMGRGSGEPEARTDPQGRFRIGGLGEEERRLVVRVSGDYVTPEPEVLVPGGAPLEIRLERGRSVRVTVIGPDGAAVAGSQVTAQPRPPSRTRDIQEMHRAMEEGRRAARTAHTGPDGVAALRGLDPTLGWHLTVQPPAERQDLRPWSSDAWSPADTEVRLEAGLAVTGFVRTPRGEPLSGAVVHAQREGGWQRSPTGRDGAFRVTELKAGEQVRLWAVASSGQVCDTRSDPLATVPAGAQGVVLVLEPGVTLSLQLVGFASTPRPPQPQVMRGGREGALEQAYMSSPQADGQVFRYLGLNAATPYTIWVPPDAEGRYGLARDVRAGGPVVVVPAQQGGTIRGTLRWPEGARDLSVSASLQGLYLSGAVDAAGGYEIRGVPPGRWEVRALGVVESGYCSARGEAEGGQTLDLTLTPAPSLR